MTRPTRILVPYDFTDSSDPALARGLAGALRSPRELHVICVLQPHRTPAAVPRIGSVDFAYAERVQQQLTQVIRVAVAVANITSPFEFFIHVRLGDPAGEILQLADEIGADEIVMGCRGLAGTARLLHASVSARIVREARCDVEIARPKQYADVELLDVLEVEPSHHHPAPFRLSYERHDLPVRANDWPLY